MNGSDHSDVPPESSFATAMGKQREAIAAVVEDCCPGSTASLRIGELPGEVRAAIIEVPLRDFVYRTSYEFYDWRRKPGKDLAPLLRVRLGEVLVSHDRFSSRLQDVRSKILPSLMRNGGMRLVTLQMNPAPINSQFEWFENLLVAEIETLDSALRLRVLPFHSFTAREFAGLFRTWGKGHSRRLARREHLAENGALFDIDTDAEDVIRRRGLSLGFIAAVAKDWREGEMFGERHARKEELSVFRTNEGRIFLAGMDNAKVTRRYIREDELEPLPH